MMDREASNSPYPSDQGGFVAGFSVGLFAGAAGYFLFATPQGAKLRKQLIEEWESAKDYMAKEGVITDSKLSLRDFLQNFFQEVFQASLPQELITPSTPNKVHKPIKVTARKAKRETVKFTGV